jgi:hypothetical protein
MTEYRNGDGLYALRRRVCTGVTGKLSFETMIEFALWGETWVRGPHTRERLANAA